MKRKYSLIWLAVAFAATVLSAQEKGPWRAASTAASSITGDVSFAEDKVTINMDSFPVAQICALTDAEAGAVFNADGPNGKGNLYRVRIAGAQKFLNKNTLCGSDEVDWIATYVSGKMLQLGFFSGQKMPVMSAEVLANSTNLCGTFSYTR